MNAIEQDHYRNVRLWLYALALLICLIVLVGGATRLTDSGLSITEWAPISGFLPPLSKADWLAEFAAYQTTDEFKVQNSSMDLAAFKTIYWWEWGHRFLGRLIGLFILLPMIWFWWRGEFTPYLKKATVIIFLLVCFQGALGWWMVKSGLVDRVDVSQIRLAVHLTTACILLAVVVWVARTLGWHTEQSAPAFAWQGAALTILVLLQIFLGGLVAGLDAGMAYNTWPKMNGEWVPSNWLAIAPIWVNFTDNAATVQFVHRISAYLLWAATLFHALHLSARLPGTTHMRRAWALVVLVTIQACIGIVTLVLQVPMSWALLHQLGGIVVLCFATAHWRAFSPTGHPAFNSESQPLNAAHAG